MSKALFLWGAGYSAKALARLAVQKNWTAAGTVRGLRGLEGCREASIDALMWNEGDPVPDAASGAHWVVSVPPGSQGCPVARSVFPGDAARAASVTYLSSTAVYGDLEGGWAFEWTPPAPSSPRARRRRLAEEQWQALRSDARLARLPGIYGPGRSVIDRLRAGRATRLAKPGQVFSRIHAGDLAAGLLALAERPGIGGVFHFCDDAPAPPQDVTAYAAREAGLPVPPLQPFDPDALSPMAASFYAECKRVSNARAKAALGWRPRYPSFQSGLSALAGNAKL